MRLCYFDAFSGISGDMTVGALLDAGADFPALQEALGSLRTEATFRLEKTKRKGIAASKFYVDAVETKKHRHLSHIVKMIEESGLSQRVKENSLAVFRKLGESEAKVHNMPLEKVHFHEVGAVDSICDIVGACFCLDNLGVETVRSGAINVGSGTVKTEHGILPVPTPATADLLLGKPIYSRGPELELTTPTGAAIVSALGSGFGPLPAVAIRSTGYGAGDKDFPDHANVLRVLIADEQSASESLTISVIETNIDDTTPEVLGYAMERLFAAGALDVTLSSIFMKKNRPGTQLTVICRPEDQEELAQVVLAETSTLGLRIFRAERRIQARQSVEVQTAHGAVRVKTSGDGFAPEYEDCRRLAEASGVPLKQILAEASFAFLKTKQS
jgi:hypothetical protein